MNTYKRQTSGIDFWIRDINGQGRTFLDQKFKALQQQSANQNSFENIDKQTTSDKTELKVHIDQKQAMAMGLTQAAMNSTLSAAWGGTYINDFIDRGRIKRVMMQGDAQFRSKPEDLQYWSVRNNQNQMVPFNQFAQTAWHGEPDVVTRYMGYAAVQMQADIKDGFSSGVAMNDLKKMVNQSDDLDLAWSGLSFQEQQQTLEKNQVERIASEELIRFLGSGQVLIGHKKNARPQLLDPKRIGNVDCPTDWGLPMK